MAGRTKNKAPVGTDILKKDLREHKIGQLYLIGGEENYLKEHYLKKLTDELLDDDFRDFNLEEFDDTSITPDRLVSAVDSYPAMAERRVIILKDFDVFKLSGEFKNVINEIFSDLPDYICIIIYYDTIEMKPDKRTKLYSLINEVGCIADFSHLERYELIPWIKRHVKAEKKYISDDTCDYMIFLCGTSMTNLETEISKVCAYSNTDEVTKKDVEAVCSKVLDAAVFDLTDAVAMSRFDKALSIVSDLIAQKNEPIVLLSTVSRHIERMYAAKLVDERHESEQTLMKLIDTKSKYYAGKIRDASRGMSLKWLRKALLLCGEADMSMKTTGADRQKVLELLLLRLACEKENGK